MQQTKILLDTAWGNQMNTGAFMHDLLDWIDNNLDSRLDIESVARRSGYSKWHLQRLFKEHTGYPLAGYIRAQKLQKSVERLTRSDEPILNVAIALGFDSQQSFNRSFKRQYGQAPGMAAQYRWPGSAATTPVIQVVPGHLFRKHHP
jgi:AraC family transcriptional activator of mar-sox-rob regulon